MESIARFQRSSSMEDKDQNRSGHIHEHIDLVHANPVEEPKLTLS